MKKQTLFLKFLTVSVLLQGFECRASEPLAHSRPVPTQSDEDAPSMTAKDLARVFAGGLMLGTAIVGIAGTAILAGVGLKYVVQGIRRTTAEHARLTAQLAELQARVGEPTTTALNEEMAQEVQQQLAVSVSARNFETEMAGLVRERDIRRGEAQRAFSESIAWFSARLGTIGIPIESNVLAERLARSQILLDERIDALTQEIIETLVKETINDLIQQAEREERVEILQALLRIRDLTRQTELQPRFIRRTRPGRRSTRDLTLNRTTTANNQTGDYHVVDSDDEGLGIINGLIHEGNIIQ